MTKFEPGNRGTTQHSLYRSPSADELGIGRPQNDDQFDESNIPDDEINEYEAPRDTEVS